MMAKQKVEGTLTFVSSFLGYTAFAGYSTYTPGKFALRGECGCLGVYTCRAECSCGR